MTEKIRIPRSVDDSTTMISFMEKLFYYSTQVALTVEFINKKPTIIMINNKKGCGFKNEMILSHGYIFAINKKQSCFIHYYYL